MKQKYYIHVCGCMHFFFRKKIKIKTKHTVCQLREIRRCVPMHGGCGWATPIEWTTVHKLAVYLSHGENWLHAHHVKAALFSALVAVSFMIYISLPFIVYSPVFTRLTPFSSSLVPFLVQILGM